VTVSGFLLAYVIITVKEVTIFITIKGQRSGQRNALSTKKYVTEFSFLFLIFRRFKKNGYSIYYVSPSSVKKYSAEYLNMERQKNFCTSKTNYSASIFFIF
jgi:hypothetical protein